MHRKVTTLAATLAIMTGSAVAKPALRDVPQIDDGLFAVGLAHEIRKNCPTIEARLFKAIGVLQDLRSEAENLGYSEAEMRRHLKSKAEKKRLRARATVYMKDRGLQQNTQGYCMLGQAEIALGSEIGALLRTSR